MVRKYTDPRSGKNYNFKDEDLTVQQMQEKIDAYEKTQAPQQAEIQQPPKPSFDKMYQDPDTENSTNDEFLKNDPDFIDASKIIFRMNRGRDFNGTDEEAGEYGLKQMGWFNYNLGATMFKANYIRRASDEQKKAFLYMMDAYDDLGLSLSGTKRAVTYMGADLTNWLSVGTLGIGVGAKFVAKKAMKQKIKKALKSSVGTGVMIATEMATFAALENVSRQTVEVAGGKKEKISGGEVALATAIGGALGGVGSVAVKTVKNLLDAKKAGKELPSEKIKVTDEEKKLLEEEAILSSNPIANNLNDIVRKIKELTDGAPVGVKEDGVQSRRVVSKIVEAVTKDFETLGLDEVDELHKLFGTELNEAQSQLLQKSLAEARDTVSSKLVKTFQILQNTTDETSSRNLIDHFKNLKTLEDKLAKVDDDFRQSSGRILGQLQDRIFAGSLSKVKAGDVMPDDPTVKLTKKQQQNLNQFMDAYVRRLHKARVNPLIKSLNRQIDSEFESGNYTKVVELKEKLREVEEELIQKSFEADGLPKKVYNDIIQPVNRLVSELMISNALSTTSLTVNGIPSFYRTALNPLLEFFGRGDYSIAAIKGVTAQYGALKEAAGAGFKAFRAALKYEKAFLTDTYDKFMEFGGKNLPSIPKRFGAGLIRTFPRLLLATDAFFEQTTYRGYIAGQAAEEFTEKALNDRKLGIKYVKSKKFKEDLKSHIKKTIDESLEFKKTAIDALIRDGKNRGLSGKKLEIFVKRAIDKNKEGMKTGLDTEGLDFTKDFLFKREFSGKGVVSRTAKRYENFVARHPIFKVVGQLFFRTPIRVMEVGVRMTPGVQFLAPKYLADLQGKNGIRRQARANGEALFGYSVVAAAMSLYITGNATGSITATNHRLRRQSEEYGDLPPYTIRIGDQEINYRNLDPISTPLKILFNSFDYLTNLEMRREQGEFVNASVYKETLQYIQTAWFAIVNTIRDANLFGGIDQLLKLTDEIDDTSKDKEYDVMEWFTSKVRLLIPKTAQNVAYQFDDQLKDPQTLEQYAMSMFKSGTIANSYTPLGRPRKIHNPFMSKFVGLNVMDTKIRKEAVTKEELYAERYLIAAGQATGTNFIPQVTHRFLPGIQLNITKTADGKETLMDRYMRKTRELRLVEVVNAYARAGLPFGTQDVAKRGAGFTKVKAAIQRIRDQAMLLTIIEEGKTEQNKDLFDKFINKEVSKSLAKAGMNEVPAILNILKQQQQ